MSPEERERLTRLRDHYQREAVKAASPEARKASAALAAKCDASLNSGVRPPDILFKMADRFTNL